MKKKRPKVVTKGKYALGAFLDYGHRQAIEGIQLLLEAK